MPARKIRVYKSRLWGHWVVISPGYGFSHPTTQQYPTAEAAWKSITPKYSPGGSFERTQTPRAGPTYFHEGWHPEIR